ncbi:hypothetical protein FQN55_001758 [Onygenales sp. PD_40]|nr:hypothetical protein FQN55_001758 [Onygenales sp. PD_40]KAK2769771.1 hypothetical protein FQN53_005913 [Emmonsiellopsis sp. PD_33]KAK2793957.1 hypothetical protein FQN52_000289 [Onygenales sp. PD_12]KAK2800641.1 hypothetical protein FQN51_006024 [Onygenales sp. PD_10]
MHFLTFFATLLLLLAPQLAAAQDEKITSTRTTTTTQTVTMTVIRSVTTSSAESTPTPTDSPTTTAEATPSASPTSTSNPAMVIAPTGLPMVMAGGIAVLLGAVV